ncbi:MAG: DNA primase [Paludibacteraceae bacterium]|nr:DNA primase [Paludibacteraceae bacterium]
MIPRETIDRIFEATKVEEVVGSYVTLKKRGANLLGLCPFHHEKTGSFTVSPSKGIFKCFGCGKAGNAVGFIMEIEQCSYIEAIRQLAQRYHITIEERELTQEEKQRQDDRESMFVVNDFSNKWFQSQLHDTQNGTAVGMAYLRQRGIREDVIRKFQLGYSPEKAKLWEAAKKAGFQDTYLVNNPDTQIGTGVCLKDEQGRLFDRFRGRVIFPFFSVSGKVTGFAGRLIKQSDKAGKYVNSPTSILYEKKHELYGFYQAKQAIKREDCCYLVEGQLDVIQLVQSGIENVVASGGTALTYPQVRLIHRFTENVTILYDGDNAGIKAALRGIDMMLEEGVNVKVVLLPKGEDPDSFARQRNATEVLGYIQQHQTDFIRFKTQLLSEDAGNDPVKRADMITQIVQSIAVIPDIIKRQIYTKDCASTLNIHENILIRKVIELRKKHLNEQRKKIPTKLQSPDHQSNDMEPQSQQVAQTQMTEERMKTPEKSSKEQNIENLMQIIIRYGEQVLFQLEATVIRTGEYIINELRRDSITIDNPLYQLILDEYMAHYQEPNWVAAKYFQHHPKAEVSQFAVDMLADKYELSRMYSKQMVSENVVKEVNVPSDLDILPELVQRMLLELKYTIVNERIDSMQTMLKEAQKHNDWELIRTILEQQPMLMDIRQQLCKVLGNRVILK